MGEPVGRCEGWPDAPTHRESVHCVGWRVAPAEPGTDHDHDVARFDNGMVACLACFHVLTNEEFHHWLDTTHRIGRVQ